MTNPVVKFLGATLLVAVTAIGAGCQTSTGGDPALVGDLLTERRITRALFDESSLDGSTILVSCVDGVVTLSGTTENQLDKSLAEQIVRNIDGVTNVVNLIQTT